MQKKLTQRKIDRYVVHLVENEKSRATVEKYQRDLLKFRDFLGNNRWISKSRVLEYKTWLLKHYKVKSVNSMLAALNGFFAFQSWQHLSVKTLKVQRDLFIPEDRELSREEYIRMLSTARKEGRDRLYMVMMTLCSTGIRVSELQFITAEAAKAGTVSIYCKNKVRLIMIPAVLRRQLLEYVKKNRILSGPVFCTRSGNALDRTNIWREMKRLAKAASVAEDKVYPHSFRHLFARTYYQKEKDIVRLADLLGHSNTETTRIYTKSTGKIHNRQISGLGLAVNDFK